MTQEANTPIVVGEDGALKFDVPDFTCPACQHTAPYRDARREVVNCSECGSRIAFGVAMPRVFVEPCDDRRFVSVRFQMWDAATKSWVSAFATTVDKDYGRAIWHNVDSICR